MTFKEQMPDGTVRIDGSPKEAWPVGSIYISVSGTSPAWFFGGTWVRFAQGRVLVGLDEGQTEFDTVEETGGEKAHTLTTAEMPAHAHALGTSISLTATGSASGGTTENGGISVAQGGTTGRFTHPVGTGGGNSGSAGGDGAHNNLQPYIAVYMWKRTA